MEVESYAICTCNRHDTRGSIHQNGKIPIEKMRADPSNPNSKILKQCIDCRIYDRASKDRIRGGIKKAHEESVANRKNGVLHCIGRSHKSISSHHREAVPEELFYQDRNLNKTKYMTCEECRMYDTGNCNDYRKRKEQEALDEGLHYCSRCGKTTANDEEVGYRLDGTPSINCEECKNYAGENCEKLREIRNNIRIEFITKNEASCECCKSIFINPNNDYDVQTILPYDIDGIKHIDYDNNIYTVKQFIVEFRHLLELRILDFDHLTENEQRERGLLKPEDNFIPKTRVIGKLFSEQAIKLEVKKCQLLCVKCHLIVTIKREIGNSKKSGLALQKQNYIDNLKISNQGCTLCKNWDSNLLRYYDFDHIDPLLKIIDIAEMVRSTSYSLEMVVDECKKCRILCRHCHRIHSDKQRLFID